MINVLIADDNIFWAKKLMEYINKNENLKVVTIAVDGKETLELLNSRNDIDIFLLDLKMPIYNGIEVLEKIEDGKKIKYKDSCIVISGEFEMIQQLTRNEIVYKLLHKNMSLNDITSYVIEISEHKKQEINFLKIKKCIIEELLYLGYNISHIGTQYLIDTICFIASRANKNCDNLKRDVYPFISKKYKTSVTNVKNNIARATNSMYYNCKSTRLLEYFKFQEDYKPNLKTIIYTILTKCNC